MQIDIMNLDGKKVGKLDLNAALFGLEVRADLLQRAVKWQLAGARAGTAHTKTRSDVKRTGKKLYAQKKTGGARHGARSAPIFVGGGVAFGPKTRDFSTSLPKKVRQLALKTALSSKVADKQLIVIDEAKLSAPKTKDLASKLAKLSIKSATFVVDATDANFELASRNLPHLKVLPTEGVNVYDILRNDVLVLTENAVKMLETRFAGEAEKTEAKKPAKAVKAPAKSKKTEA